MNINVSFTRLKANSTSTNAHIFIPHITKFGSKFVGIQVRSLKNLYSPQLYPPPKHTQSYEALLKGTRATLSGGSRSHVFWWGGYWKLKSLCSYALPYSPFPFVCRGSVGQRPQDFSLQTGYVSKARPLRPSNCQSVNSVSSCPSLSQYNDSHFSLRSHPPSLPTGYGSEIPHAFIYERGLFFCGRKRLIGLSDLTFLL